MVDAWVQIILVSLWLYAVVECGIGVLRHARRVRRYVAFHAQTVARGNASNTTVAAMWVRDEMTRLRLKALLTMLALILCWIAVDRGLLPFRRVALDGPTALSLIVFLMIIACLMTWTRQADRDRGDVFPAPPSTTAGLVYVVDDTRDARELLYGLLTRAGHAVQTFAAEDTLLHALAQQRPDVLLMDVVLGRESGVALAAQVHAQYPTLPIYLVSGWLADSSSAELRDLQAQAGAQGVLTKPIHRGQLEALIATVLAGREAPS